jgi:outer membrane immunogenic protein
MRILGASAIALIAGGTAALAADLPSTQPPPPPQAYTPTPAFSWTGPYVGLTGGYGWDSGNVGDGWIGGFYAGYNFQLDPHWVAGIEGDFTFTSKDGPVYSNPWNSSVRGRLGYAWDRYLLYGTAGVAFGKLEGGGGSSTETGWTAGIGAEAVLAGNVTGRLEYRHTDLGSNSFGASSASNDLLLGVGLKF